jgi:hypothetical protein
MPETSTKNAIQEIHLRKLQIVISISRRGVTILVYKICSPGQVDANGAATEQWILLRLNHKTDLVHIGFFLLKTIFIQKIKKHIFL